MLNDTRQGDIPHPRSAKAVTRQPARYPELMSISDVQLAPLTATAAETSLAPQPGTATLVDGIEKLAPGNLVKGPAVIHTPITTIVLQANQTGTMDGYRNIIIDFVR